jgi:pseudouridine synthase
LDKIPSDDDIRILENGVVITTLAQRSTVSKPITAKTLPCKITRNKRLPNMSVLILDPLFMNKALISYFYRLEILLTEGRNRQIRKMVEAIGYQVMSLHRTSFSGITLSGLSEDNWAELNEKEMSIILKSISIVSK